MTNILCIILSRDDFSDQRDCAAAGFFASGAGDVMESKTIGIVGITAEGASLCYRTIVAESARALPGGAHPPIAMYTGSFAVLNERLSRRDWPGVGALISDSIKRLISSGAELVIMSANATHYAIDYFLPQCPVPFLSIVDVSADACVQGGYSADTRGSRSSASA
jgi:aspartate racemase